MKNENTAKDFDGRSVYERTTAVFFDSNPVEDLNDTVHHKFMGYGTAAHEFFNEKKVLIEMARTQSDQIRNSNIEVNRKIIFERALADSTSYLIVEEFDFHDVDNGHHYSMRLSTILEKTDGRWLVSHMHGSTPDSNIAEEEALPMEGLRRKNRELEKKIKEGIREAELEAALERIRSSSLAMQKPDDLRDVVTVLFEQMQELSVDMGFASVSIFIFEEGTRDFTQWLPLPDGVTSLHIPYIDHPITSDLFDARESGTDYFEKVYSVEEKNSWVKKGFEATDYKKLPEEFKTFLLEAPGYAMSISLAKHSGICIPSFDGKLPSPENVAILKRVGKVFEQAYTRFLDLQKAEAQAKEAKIEAALEKVRSRSLAMHKSEELAEASSLLFQQMKALGVSTYSSGFTIWDEDQDELISWMCNADGSMNPPFRMPITENRWHHDQYIYWKNGKDLAVKDFTGEEMQLYFRYLRSFPLLDEAFEKSIAAGHPMPERQVHHVANFSHGNLLFITLEPCPKVHELFKRFAKVFEQTYIRFLDLQKSEEQTREAQIEAALERVRSRSMGMQKSSDLRSVVDTLYGEFKRLRLIFDNVVIQLLLDDTKDFHMWITSEDGLYEDIIHWPYVDIPVFHEFYEARIGNKSINYRTSSEAETIEFFEEYFKLDAAPQERKAATKQVKSINNMGTYQEHTGIFLMRYTEGEYSEKDKEIVRRFAKVFEQTYTRFLDLQQAEAQARESEIQLALERVRARSMAMHQSDELADLSLELVKQVHALGIDTWFCAFNIYDDHPEGSIEWGSNGQGTFPRYRTPREGVFLDYYEAGQRGETLLINEIGEDECPAHYDYLCSLPGVGDQLLKMKDEGIPFPNSQIDHVAFFKYGYIIFITFEPVPKAHDIFKRFAKVFQQTYTRFLDLKKAEEQAREAEIEAALERVRSRSLAMHKPDELQDVVRVVAEELKNTGVILDTGGAVICTYFQDSRDVIHWTATDDPAHPSVPYLLPYFEDELFDEAWESKSRGDDYFAKVFSYGVKNAFFSHAFEHSDYRQLPDEYKKIILESKSHGIAWAWAQNSAIMIPSIQGDLPSEEEKKTLIRFAKVFEQSFIRFLDLQKAEAQALEATKQASLDRVRGEIASMRSAKDLEIITPLIWNELTTLGIPFIRCGVFIIHEEDEQVEVYLSKPDGTSLAVMHLPFGSNELVRQTVDAWQQDSVYTQHWTREEFLDWGQSMMEQGQVTDLESYQGAEEAPQSLSLHFIPFTQGMLYVGSTNPLDEQEISLSESLAKAFSIAYARYEDFVKLEKAKAGIEEALAELKATQTQLIQQEKLASLGQLTAGIAHEIKNPLNFVNNFSDVSIEMIEEALEEVKKVNLKFNIQNSELSDILADIKSNLAKIHEHGSRADGIVKSMLQHSRGGDGKMEPTPLNPLIKEYVNLAFHGMRAGKEPINVDIDLQLDENVGEVPLISEDFSRVILNLCNNAFDAMRSVDSMSDNSVSGRYKPILSVRTHQAEGSVTIEIEDNGPGIPDEIKDKIMQPFFTTKKGTAGTGLGLSITNDIIKAHGGTLDIQSQPGQTVFIIKLNES